jgi:hypothetical protein
MSPTVNRLACGQQLGGSATVADQRVLLHSLWHQSAAYVCGCMLSPVSCTPSRVAITLTQLWHTQTAVGAVGRPAPPPPLLILLLSAAPVAAAVVAFLLQQPTSALYSPCQLPCHPSSHSFTRPCSNNTHSQNQASEWQCRSRPQSARARMARVRSTYGHAYRWPHSSGERLVIAIG